MRNKSYTFGIIAVILSAIMWGIDGVILTPRLLDSSGHPINVTLVVFLLHCIPFILMNTLFFKFYKLLRTFTISDYIYAFGVALLGGTLGTMCIVKALFCVNFQNLTIVTLLQKLQPIFAILLSVIILKEKLSKRFILWAIIALAAGYVMTFEFKLPAAAGNNIIKAAILALLAAVSFGSSTVLSKKLLLKYTPENITFFRYGFTTVIALIIVIATRNLNFEAIHNIPPVTWMIFLIIAFTTGSGAILLYYYGLKQIKASVSSICELFFPITAAVADYFLNDNTMSPVQWIAASIMVFAIIQLSKNK